MAGTNRTTAGGLGQIPLESTPSSANFDLSSVELNMSFSLANALNIYLVPAGDEVTVKDVNRQLSLVNRAGQTVQTAPTDGSPPRWDLMSGTYQTVTTTFRFASPLTRQ